MGIEQLLDVGSYHWAVLPVLIFFARIVDVSLDTIRIIFISRSLRHLAPIVGFFEVCIWLLAVRQVLMGDHINIPCMVGYAAGFAVGNYAGIYLESILSIGKVIIRVITRVEADELVDNLKAAGFGLTVLEAEGATGPVKVVFTIIERHDIPRIVELIKEFNPQAFYTIEDVRFVSENVLPFRLKGSRLFSGIQTQR